MGFWDWLSGGGNGPVTGGARPSMTVAGGDGLYEPIAARPPIVYDGPSTYEPRMARPTMNDRGSTSVTPGADRSGVWESDAWKEAIGSLGTGPVGNLYPGTGGAAGGQENPGLEALRAMAAGGGGASAPSLGGIRAQIESEYGSLIGRLDEMYQLAETDQERGMIEFALEDLSDQYRAAQESIGMVWDTADEQVGMYADRATDRAAGMGDMVRAEYDAGVERSMQQEAMARALLGEQFGDAYAQMQSGAGGARSALDAALMENAGTRESAYRQETADMTAEDARWLEAQQQSLRGANTAEASRLDAALRAEAIRQHEAQVAARINQERLARAAAEQQLVQAKLAQQAQLAQQEASMRAAASRANASNRAAAQRQLAEMGGAGGNLAFGDFRLNPDSQGRVGPNGVWSEGAVRDAIYGYMGAVEADPANYFQERSRVRDALLTRAGVEGQAAIPVEGYINDLLDMAAPDAYQQFRAQSPDSGSTLRYQ